MEYFMLEVFQNMVDMLEPNIFVTRLVAKSQIPNHTY